MTEESKEIQAERPSGDPARDTLNPPKRIVICFDGTWNHFLDVKTNVFRLSEALEHSTSQYTQYWNGIGTKSLSVHQGYVDFWLRVNKILPGARYLGFLLAGIIEFAYARLFRFLGGAAGFGIAWDLSSAYEYVARYYLEGDSVCLFGFSRGAYTARSFASLLHKCGLVRPEQTCSDFSSLHAYWTKNRADLLSKRNEALALYRSGTTAEQAAFKQSRCHPDCPIEVIGVWDTVGSLGLPAWLDRLNPWSHDYHDIGLTPETRHAFHALAIDEHRRAFSPTLWNHGDRLAHQTLEQVWFAGDHSDIGGGHGASGLSDISLQWMIEKAAACGLTFWSDPRRDLAPGTARINRPRGLGRLFPTRTREIPVGPESRVHASVQSMLDDPTLEPRYAPANIVSANRLDENYRVVE